MTSRFFRAVASIGWLPLIAWVFVYIPVVVRMALHEGAGDGMAVLLTGFWLFGPAVLMFTVQRTLTTTSPRLRQARHLSVLLLLGALGLLVSALLPRPASNSDLFLPTIVLAVFLLVHALLPLIQRQATAHRNA